MQATRRFILVVVMLFAVAVVVASIYTLEHVHHEANRQASLDMDRRLKTFWELVRTKGNQFAIKNNRLLIGNYVVNGNYELPDKVRDIFGGTATVFMGNVRVSTNVPSSAGGRAVGTRLVGAAYDAIFVQGHPYRGEADILGVKYFTAYDPIRDPQGRVIGALYVGVEKGVFLDHYNHLMVVLLMPVLFLACISVLFYIMLLKEAHRNEQLQKQDLRFLQTLIDTLPIPVYYKDWQGRYLGCNSAFERFFGIKCHQIVGKNLASVVSSDRASFYTEKDRSLFEEPVGTKQQFETTILDALGEERDAVFYKATFEGDINVVGGLVGAILDITEHKAAEERLRASERQMADIINFLPDATWVIDKGGCIVAWNRACEELTGVSAAEMIGQGNHVYAVPFYGVNRPLLIDGALQGVPLTDHNYCSLEQATHVVTAEAFVPCVYSGKGAYLWGIACRLYDAKGRVAGAIESVRDVTERKHAEIREHGRADILEHIAKDASLDEVLTAIVRDIEQEHPDLLCSILLRNKQGTRLLHGVAPSLPDSYNRAVNGIKVMEGAGSCGTAAFLKRRVVVANIEQHPYWKGFQAVRDAGLKSCWSEPILSSTGDLYGTFALYSRTVWEPGPEEIRLIVTAANYASIAIERMNTVTALRESERKYRELVENANSLILRMDTEGRITFFNEYAQQFFGYTEDEILGQHMVGTIVPDFESSGRDLAEMISDICRHPERYMLNEYENMRKNGELVQVSWSNRACTAPDGMLEEILCVGQDVTERKKMQEIMVQTEKMMTVGGLAAGMAHELNNPIGTIAQHAQNIIRRISTALPANTAAAVETGVVLSNVEAYLKSRGVIGMLDAIVASCERASGIINNMLAFSRKSANQMEPVSLPELVEKATELAICDYDLKKQYDFKNIKIVKEFDPDMPLVNVVPLEIEQVLLNLLKNAAHASVQHSPNMLPTITIRLKKDGQAAVIEIEDNGPGIPKEQRSRIFEPFYTTKEVGVGTGLGLSISYSIIVNKHQGSISVESPPGKGACFNIRLPCTASE